jgi:hypothetical protein
LDYATPDPNTITQTFPSSSFKRKSHLEDDIPIPKKPKFSGAIALGSPIDHETAPSCLQSQPKQPKKKERQRKKNFVESPKLSARKKKSHGYSSEEATSEISLPNSEEGLAKPPQVP